MLEVFSDLGWIVGLVSIVFLYLVYWYQRPNYFPPGPRGIPLLGCLPIMADAPHKKAYELSKKYGPVVAIRMGSNDSIFLNDYESINQAFVKQGQVFSDRVPFPILQSFKKGHGLAFIDANDLWKSQRKFGLMTLRGFGIGKKGMENICLEELFYVNEEIRKHNGKPFDAQVLLHDAVSNNICNVIFGHRFEYKDEHFQKMLYLLIELFGDDPLISISNKLTILVPALKHVPPISWGFRKVVTKLEGLFDWLRGIIKEHERTFDENSLRDFIDAFILEKRKGDPDFSDEQLVNFIQELFFAGSGTAASTLYWALLCLIHHPEAQKKIRKEVTDNFGSSGTISYSKKSEMPFSCAFVQEVFRYRPIGPIGLPHKVSETTQFGKWIIPKGTQVQANIWAVHNDPKLWNEPGKFLPQRFIDDHGNFISSNHVIPFSVGPRHCLGEQLARMEVFIFLVGMVQKFEFLPENKNKLPSIDKMLPSLALSPTPYKVIAKQI